MIVWDLDSIGVFYGQRAVLTVASLRAHAGQITALVGRNGAGKTSLLRAGVGLEPRDHGNVRLAGRRYGRPRLARLARAGLFYLPARDVLDPFLSVRRQVAAVSAYFGETRPADVLGALDLEPVADRCPASLSGGERRRAEIAIAIARRPTCLVADEPFRGLDPLDTDRVGQAFRMIAHGGAAVVLTGHELGPIRSLADAVVWCVARTTRQFPTAEAAWSDAQLRQEFLGPGPAGTGRAP